MSDDSIQIYEMQNRNSGIWEGKFLERSKYKNIEISFTVNMEEKQKK